MSSTEVTASEQLQPTPSTAVVSGKRQRDESQVTDRLIATYSMLFEHLQNYPE